MFQPNKSLIKSDQNVWGSVKTSFCFGNKCCKSTYFVTIFSYSHVFQSNLQFVGELFSKIDSGLSKSTFFVLIDHVPSIFGAVTELHMMLVGNG